MKLKYILISIIFISVDAFAQSSIENILQEVENNNTTLSALRLKVDADKLGNKTEIYLQNPEVEFNYLWGNPDVIGNRIDISVTQSFDFPTAYSYKNQISELKNEQLTLEYEKQRKDILLKTKMICNDLIYLNRIIEEYEQRIENATHLVDLFQIKFEKGEANILDYNKAKLGLLDVNKKAESYKLDRNVKLAELARLNGGNTIQFTKSDFPVAVISENFDTWYTEMEQNNTVLSWLKLESEIRQKNEKLNTALSLPKFQTGYMSEKVVGEQFHGVTLGLVVPLWENKNKVKQAKANIDAAEAEVADNKVQFYNYLKGLHAKAVQLQKTLSDYQEELAICNNTELAVKALDAGEISMIDYIMEITIYYESVKNMMEIEKELNLTLAELNQFVL
jgi:outer membrane protein TolC